MRYLRFPVSRLALLAGVLSLFFACSSDDVPDGLLEIRMISGFTHVSTDSRGSGEINKNHNETLFTSFVRTDQSLGGSYPATYSGVGPLSAEIHKDDKHITLWPQQYYLTSGKESRFIGWYPATDNEKTPSKWDASKKTVTFPKIDGSTDILVAQPVYGSRSSKFSVVTFSHALTQVRIFIKVDDIKYAEQYWGEITDIEFVGKKQDIVFTLPDPQKTSKNDTVSFFPDPKDATDLKMMAKGGTEPHGNLTLDSDTEYIEVGYAMFASHQSNPDAELKIKITTTVGGVHTVPVPYGKANLHAGGIYLIKMDFRLVEIQLNAAIEEWVPDTNPPDPLPVG